MSPFSNATFEFSKSPNLFNVTPNHIYVSENFGFRFADDVKNLKADTYLLNK